MLTKSQLTEHVHQFILQSIERRITPILPLAIWYLSEKIIVDVVGQEAFLSISALYQRDFDYHKFGLKLVSENITNVQSAPNFQHIIDSIKSKHKIQHELIHDIAVLQSGSLLVKADMYVEFIDPIGRPPGNTFDLLTKNPKGEDLPCEVKTLQNSKLKFSSYAKKLLKAQEQMKIDGTRMIFTKVPSSWASDPDFKKVQMPLPRAELFGKLSSDLILMWEELRVDRWVLPVVPIIAAPSGDFNSNGMYRYISHFDTHTKGMILEDFVTEAFKKFGIPII